MKNQRKWILSLVTLTVVVGLVLVTFKTPGEAGGRLSAWCLPDDLGIIAAGGSRICGRLSDCRPDRLLCGQSSSHGRNADHADVIGCGGNRGQ